MQPFEAYLWQAHVSPGHGLWPLPGVYQVPSIASSRGEHHANQPAVLQPFNQYGEVYTFGCLAESLSIPHLPYMMGRGILSRYGST